MNVLEKNLVTSRVTTSQDETLVASKTAATADQWSDGGSSLLFLQTKCVTSDE